jgi:hypothetical protein
VPVFNNMPPVGTSYQCTIAPLLAVAFSVTVPAPHLALGVVPVIVGSIFTVTVTGGEQFVVVLLQGEIPTLRT